MSFVRINSDCTMKMPTPSPIGERSRVLPISFKGMSLVGTDSDCTIVMPTPSPIGGSFRDPPSSSVQRSKLVNNATDCDEPNDSGGDGCDSQENDHHPAAPYSGTFGHTDLNLDPKELAPKIERSLVEPAEPISGHKGLNLAPKGLALKTNGPKRCLQPSPLAVIPCSPFTPTNCKVRLQTRSIVQKRELFDSLITDTRFSLGTCCHICQVDFTLFNRRHHCRMCGLSICAAHSKNIQSSNDSNLWKGMASKTRICSKCVEYARNLARQLQSDQSMGLAYIDRSERVFLSFKTKKLNFSKQQSRRSHQASNQDREEGDHCRFNCRPHG